ncbi:hypothetical protein ASF53_01175 [Methylobacterium sp. Leaf123]|uniref:hypothetical protein n=1 Tax=Methylobacterium sp. Leaf123 TaxID=1736264 RepID=UPI0006F3A2C6|nr:hypothetical protein [Methylobacterium sp. Leaf123]KQQ31352.1 hypothetical protein ASF53_01175 [Methylobacterium sp. Leaf123]
MPSTLRRSGQRLALVLASSAFILSTAAGVHAQEGGLGGLFQQLFSPQRAAPAPVVAPIQVYGGGEVNERYRWRRHRGTADRSRPKVRYAALPKDDGLGISGKQPVDSKAIAANPTAALLRDETLRPGDIVVMPNGPKVFMGHDDRGRGRGAKAARHRMSDFEDVKHARTLNAKTRRQLMAMMLPHGAMPAEEVRKALAKARRLAPQETIEPLTRQARAETGPKATRIISPWQIAR